MRGLYRYLSPFSPDQSGAVSVLYELGGVVVIMDAGGCAGNVCGFDEPRYLNKRSAVYSAGIRDMDAILGRDDLLIRKLAAVKDQKPNFIALIGTPVPATVATDLPALARIAEKKYGIPSFAVETAGVDFYDRGQEKGYSAVLDLVKRLGLKPGPRDVQPGIGIWGAAPLDLPADDSGQALRAAAEADFPEYGPAVTFGLDSGLEAFAAAGGVKMNLAVSPSGVSPARRMEKEFGIPWKYWSPGFESCAFKLQTCPAEDMKILVVHQQVTANAVRDYMARTCPKLGKKIDVGSFFLMDKTIMKEGDRKIGGEDELIRILKEGGYTHLMIDPAAAGVLRAIPDRQIRVIPLRHMAVGGGLRRPARDADYWREASENIAECFVEGE